ncbi:M949_RS01915 family surface polysaccharide biosynthesis protein [Pseudomonas defluvii]|uniref:M949_RS01915 family surface polysaccharide biosynthesis protein n=1 Tax=Pseudomonas defluvii TaxID=1876757 RepID=UPI0039067146
MSVKRLWLLRPFVVSGLVLLSACGQGGFEVLAPLPAAQIDALGVDAPLKTVHFRDKDGEGLLVLSRTDGQATDEETAEDVDKVVLIATLYGRTTADEPFKSRWQIDNETTCAGLDLDVGFYPDVTGVSDLNNDGVAELTIASHAFCGGGIDPHAIMVELREGQAYYAIEGQSLVSVPGDGSYGGERKDSPSLTNAPKVLRDHLEAVWSKVYKRPWSHIDGGGDNAAQ